MNAKPTIETVRERNSQLELADLRDRFNVTEARWIVWRHRGRLRAWADTRKNRKKIADLGFEAVTPVGGVSRNTAVKMVRRALSARAAR